MSRWLRPIVAVTLIAFLAVFAWTASCVFQSGATWIYAENGPLENAQAVLAAVACLVFLAPVIGQRRPDKLILLFCALFCYVFVLRELDVETFDVPQWVKVAGSGKGRNWSEAVALLALLAYACLRLRHSWRLGIAFVKSPAGTLWLLGSAFLLVGDRFDKAEQMLHHAYWEELSELLGYAFVLLSAIAVNGEGGRSTRAEHLPRSS